MVTPGRPPRVLAIVMPPDLFYPLKENMFVVADLLGVQ